MREKKEVEDVIANKIVYLINKYYNKNGFFTRLLKRTYLS